MEDAVDHYLFWQHLFLCLASDTDYGDVAPGGLPHFTEDVDQNDIYPEICFAQATFM